ncbi:hypothetical protein C0J52_04973 [Blattella germanica]|nr:hypothetical protein C0J52_04973 [Blattella germanica]
MKVNNLQWTNQKEEDHKNDGEEKVGSGQRNKTYIQRLRNNYSKNDRHIQGVHYIVRNFWSTVFQRSYVAGTNCIRSTFRLELETVTQMPLVLRLLHFPVAVANGFLKTRMTESPRRNIFEINLSLFTGFACKEHNAT